MNDRNLDQLLTAWMDLGPTSAPDRVADAARLEAATTRQTAIPMWWPPRRFPMMNVTAKVALATAAVVVAAILGYSYLIAPNVGDDNPGPNQTPTPAPSPAPILGTTDLEPGTYAIGEFFPVQFDLTITDEWETWGANRDIVRIWKPCEPTPCEGYSAILDFEIVRTTLEPCQGDIPDPLVGEGVDDLVSALTTLPGFEAGQVADVSVDGHAGRAFDLSFVGPADPGCDEGGAWQWLSSERVTWGPDADQHVIVLDVDSTRLVIDEIVYAGDRQEMDDIIESIDFHP